MFEITLRLPNSYFGVHNGTDGVFVCFYWILQAIGAEYGEGFETFRPNGLLKVDVVRPEVQTL